MTNRIAVRAAIVAFAAVVTLGPSARRAAAEPSASLVLEPASSTAVMPGEAVLFDVFLRSYAPDDAGSPAIAFGLNVGASDPALTGGGSDFGRFAFTLDPGLAGVLGGLAFDDDISDDGRVEFGADLPPFGSETGILASMGDVRLGTLSVIAPSLMGTFGVAFSVDPTTPTAGTYLLIDDGSPLGLVLPGDGALVAGEGRFTVSAIPEPGSVVLLGVGVLALAGLARRRGVPSLAA